MSLPRSNLWTTDWTLLTGATGFIGRHVLSALLRQGRRVMIGARGDLNAAWGRLLAMPELAEADLERRRRQSQVAMLRVELGSPIELPHGECVSTVVHAAGCVTFAAKTDGDPHRTNVAGTEQVLDWAATHGVAAFHLVSTAYVCGECSIGAESIAAVPPVSRNDYEASKWLAEVAASRWAQTTGASLTVHRPAIVVGAFETGAAAKFDGMYLMVRAAHQVSRRFSHGNHAVPLRIEGTAGGQENIVPVDWVAGMIAGIVDRPELHGQVYNLVHPHPPTNAHLKEAVEAYCAIDVQFVDPATFGRLDLTLGERVFADMSRQLCPYVCSSQRFGRENTAQAEAMLGLPCPQFTAESLARLVRFAIESKFGRRAVRDFASPWCAEYFERFLPQTIPQCSLIRAAAMDVTVRFIVGDGSDDNWLCRFEQGRLSQVIRACRVTTEDVAYRVTNRAFWQCISGQVDPQDLFQRGEADILGDVEKGLKVAFLLQAFSQEFPCDPTVLAANLARRSA